MNAKVFVDTNVLVYFRDSSEPEKQPRAAHWLTTLWESRLGRISFQVLTEYYVTVTQKLDPGLSKQEARSDVNSLLTWSPIAIDPPLLQAAWTIQDRHGFSWWDSLIAAAAQRQGCTYLLSEDFQDGQTIDGITILDPFRHTPADDA